MSDTALPLPRLAAAERAPRSARARGYWRTVGRRLSRDYVTLFFALVIVVIALAAILAPLIAPFDPNATSIVNRLKPIGYKGLFILGTDELGGFLGLIAGFAGGWVNALIMRIMDVFYAFPSVLLAVAISGTMGGGIVVSLVALTLVFIPPLCRVSEAATTQIRSRDFVDAARASGASSLSIMLYHVLRNVLAPVLIYASSLISVSILLAAGLSFLGLGVEPPTPDWGLMLSTLRQSIYVQPVICALPGAAIFVCSLSFNLVSDGLRQAMDIKA
jgi:peptide/nickel transport system permease protein